MKNGKSWNFSTGLPSKNDEKRLIFDIIKKNRKVGCKIKIKII